jgi:hypothetical protein
LVATVDSDTFVVDSTVVVSIDSVDSGSSSVVR